MTYDIWLISEARRRAIERAATLGCVADLPHPFLANEHGRCKLCNGAASWLIHAPPWYRPIYGACEHCQPRDWNCVECGGSHIGTRRIGIEDVPEPQPRKTYIRTWQPGSKYKRRKGRWLKGIPWTGKNAFDRKEAARHERHAMKQELDNTRKAC